jgi:hypothetical protein
MNLPSTFGSSRVSHGVRAAIAHTADVKLAALYNGTLLPSSEGKVTRKQLKEVCEGVLGIHGKLLDLITEDAKDRDLDSILEIGLSPT